MQSCARCGFVVYPAEKINCIDQNWHKACFHCDVCKMVLTANNFVSHKKRPYCSVHNPRNNTFTSVYETPININAKKQSKASSEVRFSQTNSSPGLHYLCFQGLKLYIRKNSLASLPILCHATCYRLSVSACTRHALCLYDLNAS
uniref:LIM and SH3 domain protein 1 n=1 Tax=Oryzias latipes TaxID=8090 RepID=A0A3B3IPG1_ORYLA